MNMKQKLVSPVLMWLIVVSGLLIVFYFVSPRFIFPRNIYASFLIIPAILYWMYFFIGAIIVHRRAPYSVDKIDHLVTSGVYDKVRHPIYSADIALCWSIFFFYPDVRFLIGAHWLMFVLLYWMEREERSLIEKFGNEYLIYKDRVPKLIPRMRSARDKN